MRHESSSFMTHRCRAHCGELLEGQAACGHGVAGEVGLCRAPAHADDCGASTSRGATQLARDSIVDRHRRCFTLPWQGTAHADCHFPSDGPDAAVEHRDAAMMMMDTQRGRVTGQYARQVRLIRTWKMAKRRGMLTLQWAVIFRFNSRFCKNSQNGNSTAKA